MEQNMNFFAEKGLTTTSANHVANMAKEYVKEREIALGNLKLYSTTVGLVSSDSSKVLSRGVVQENLDDILPTLESIASANSLIAWLREAIKAKQKMMDACMARDINEWVASAGYKVPVAPVQRVSRTSDEIIASRPIKERNRILSLQARAAVIGKYVHPDGTFSKARRDMYNVIQNPRKVEGSGRDMVMYDYTPTVTHTAVEDIFFQLQSRHREIQAELNGLLHAVEEEARVDAQAAMVEYKEAYERYCAECKKLRILFSEWQEKESGRIADLKIVIPNDLKGIYDKVNALGK